MQEHALLHGHTAMLQENNITTGQRQYFSLPSWQEAFGSGGGLLAGVHQHFFEIIRHQQPCKPYLDIDCAGGLPEGYTKEDVMRSITNVVCLIFKEDFQLNLQPEAVIWLESPNPEKISAHLIISSHQPQFVFRSNHFTDAQGAYQLAIRVGTLPQPKQLCFAHQWNHLSVLKNKCTLPHCLQLTLMRKFASCRCTTAWRM